MTRSYACPVEFALEFLGGKWRVVILARLKGHELRYADLRRKVPRMSDKMLTQRMRELVDAGLVQRRAGRYALTPRGESARAVFESLYVWGEALAPEIGVEFDTATAPRRQKRA
jgi:DNA-binding HxlR family transcriptional regulator